MKSEREVLLEQQLEKVTKELNDLKSRMYREITLHGKVLTITSSLKFISPSNDEELYAIAHIVSLDTNIVTIQFDDADRCFDIEYAEDLTSHLDETTPDKLYILHMVRRYNGYLILDFEEYRPEVDGDTDMRQFDNGFEITFIGKVEATNALGFFTIELVDETTTAVYCDPDQIEGLDKYIAEKCRVIAKICNGGERLELVSLDLHS